MPDPAYVTGEATGPAAAPVIALVQEAGAAAADHFETLPPGEEASAYVILTSPTGYGRITLGAWLFLRDTTGTVTLHGAEPEATGG